MNIRSSITITTTTDPLKLEFIFMSRISMRKFHSMFDLNDRVRDSHIMVENYQIATVKSIQHHMLI